MENSDFVYVKTVKLLQVFPTLYFIEILLFSFFNLEGVLFWTGWCAVISGIEGVIHHQTPLNALFFFCALFKLRHDEGVKERSFYLCLVIVYMLRTWAHIKGRLQCFFGLVLDKSLFGTNVFLFSLLIRLTNRVKVVLIA
jgi:hypothetical protein